MLKFILCNIWGTSGNIWENVSNLISEIKNKCSVTILSGIQN